jgi:hypothetical protein
MTGEPTPEQIQTHATQRSPAELDWQEDPTTAEPDLICWQATCPVCGYVNRASSDDNPWGLTDNDLQEVVDMGFTVPEIVVPDGHCRFCQCETCLGSIGLGRN